LPLRGGTSTRVPCPGRCRRPPDGPGHFSRKARPQFRITGRPAAPRPPPSGGRGHFPTSAGSRWRAATPAGPRSHTFPVNSASPGPACGGTPTGDGSIDPGLPPLPSTSGRAHLVHLHQPVQSPGQPHGDGARRLQHSNVCEVRRPTLGHVVGDGERGHLGVARQRLGEAPLTLAEPPLLSREPGSLS
jgi:hypothetical protein